MKTISLVGGDIYNRFEDQNSSCAPVEDVLVMWPEVLNKPWNP